MFSDFELFYSRPRFNINNADSNSPTPKLITSIDHDTSPGAVQPVLPSSTMTTGHLTPWAVAAGDTIARHLFPRRAQTYFIITRHVFLVEHELISRYHQSSLDTFSSSSTNWFPDVITPRRARTDFLMSSLLVEHELISWLSSDITRHVFLVKHELRNKSTSLFKGLVDPRSSSFACDVHLLPGPGPALTSAAISDKFVVAFLSYNFWTSPSQSSYSYVSWMWFTSIANYH